MTIEYSFDEIEQFGRQWTDRFAMDCAWEAHVLEDPVDDLALFFEYLQGTDILDVGCGWARYVHRFFKQGLTYTGIDHSIEMLKAARGSNPEINLLQASFRALPFPNQHFDGLWSCCSLSAVPKAQLVTVLQEHLRVLKSGGVVMIVMPLMPYSDEGMYLEDDGTPSIYQSHYHLSEFIEYLSKAGFEVARSDYRLSHGSMFVLARKPK